MNKKGQLFDEINPIYVLMSIVAGAIAIFVSARVPNTSKLIPVLAGVLSAGLAYVYLVMTDKG